MLIYVYVYIKQKYNTSFNQMVFLVMIQPIITNIEICVKSLKMFK